MTTYPWKVRAGASFSQFINATFLGGHMNQTISARAWEMKDTSATWLIVHRMADGLFGEGHCLSSYVEDYEFAQDILNAKVPLQ